MDVEGSRPRVGYEILVVRLAGLLMAEQAESKVTTLRGAAALIDCRVALIVTTAAAFAERRIALGDIDAPVALLGTEAQMELLSEYAWRMCQAGVRRAAFEAESEAWEWLER